MVDGTFTSTAQSDEQHCAKMKTVFYKENEGEWAKAWEHFDAVKKGDLLIQYKDGRKITAQEDGFLILPKNFATIGGEWIYFGVSSDFPCST